MTTTFGYATGSETRSLPGAGTVTTTFYVDSQVKQVFGASVVTTTYGYGLVNGLIRETVTRGTAPDLVTSIAERNGSGQTVREKLAGPGNSWRIYGYDPLGREISERIDGTQTRSVGYDAAGSRSDTVLAAPDPARTFGVVEAFVEDAGVWRERRVCDGSWMRERLDLGALLSLTVNRAANGRMVTTTTTFNSAAAEVTADTVDSAVGNHAVMVSRGGAVVSAKLAGKSGPTTYAYDALGRPVLVTDTVTGAVTTMSYDPATGQVANTTTASGGSTTSTVNQYYSAAETAAGQMPGRLHTRTVKGDETPANWEVTTYTYTPRGELETVTGATYPLKYVYDNAGRLKYLHTYRAEPGATLGAGDVTEWVYEAGTMLLHQKKDAANAGPVYGYDALGRLQTRTWTRSVGASALITTYSYNVAGDMSHIDYSDNTPDVTLGYDGRGRLASRTVGTETTTLRYHGETGQVADEIGSDGSRLHREVDGVGRETGYYVWDGQRFATWGGWGYAGNTGRLNGALTEAGWVDDAETTVANSVNRTLTLTGTTVQTKMQRDGLGRLKSLSTLVGANTRTPLAGRRYEYNANGRIANVREGNTADGGGSWTEAERWDYTYNGRGEVNLGAKTLADGSTAAGTGFGYDFDAIGNRKTATREDSINEAFTRNSLNQYTTITRGSGAGMARGEFTPAPGAQVTVNGVTPDVQLGSYFARTVEAAPGNDPQWLSVNVTEQRVINSVTQTFARDGSLFWPGRVEAPFYDADGNLTQDARWTYTWDAENRLVAMETRWTSAQVPGLPQLRLEFAYDGLSRRVKKVVKERAAGNTWQTLRTLRFAYEGWNLIAESEPTGGTTSNVLRTYQWSTDLSGSRQGAGGVGGLMMINTHNANGTLQSYYPCYGDNGNIAALLDLNASADITVAAAYEYGPFGEPLRATGAMAKGNPFRWSTKYCDEETGLCYYGYRYYSPGMGRWINRDPMAERGGSNLLCFVRNNPVRRIDPFGLIDDFGYDSGTDYTPPPNNSNVDCSRGFCVIGSDINAETLVERALAAAGVDHVDISYNGKVVFVGMGGGVDRATEDVTKGNRRRTQLSIREKGTHRAGFAKDCPCKAATPTSILDCIKKYKFGGSNCQGSVKSVIDACCLEGWWTLGAALSTSPGPDDPVPLNPNPPIFPRLGY